MNETQPNGLFEIDTRSRSDQIRDRIIALIHEGHVKPGERLPSQRELAGRFGVGLSSVREAIQSLVAVGTLESRHGRGVFVRQLSPVEVTRLVGASLHLDREASLQLVEARAMIEVTSARLAAARHTQADLDAMAEAIERSGEYINRDDLEGLIAADMAFHAALVAAARNQVVSTMLESVSGLMQRDRLESYRHGEGPFGLVVMHRKIYRAVEAGDASKAAQLMEEHLELTRQFILKRTDPNGEAER